MSKELATITREAPVEIKIEDVEYEGFDKEKVINIFKELGFNSLLEKLGGDTEAVEEKLEEIEFIIADEIKEEMFTDENAFYVELLEDNYHYADIIGFSVANDKGNFSSPKKRP